MKIHTLGPKTTDSYQAYQYTLKHFAGIDKYELALHTSFDDIYQHLSHYSGDLFLVPVAYRSENGSNWTDNNLIYGSIITIKQCFSLPLKPMALVQKNTCNNQRAIIHPSTIGILHHELPKLNRDMIKFVASKPLALQYFVEQDFQYGVFSYADFKPYEVADKYQLIKLFAPAMIWCLYSIN